jgi:hypothetical protein
MQPAGQVLVSTDKGNSWTPFAPLAGKSIKAIYAIDS